MILLSRLFGRRSPEPSTSSEDMQIGDVVDRIKRIAAPHRSVLAEQADRRKWEQEHGKRPVNVEHLHPPRDPKHVPVGSETIVPAELVRLPMLSEAVGMDVDLTVPRRPKDEAYFGVDVGKEIVPPYAPAPLTGFFTGLTGEEERQLMGSIGPKEISIKQRSDNELSHKTAPEEISPSEVDHPEQDHHARCPALLSPGSECDCVRDAPDLCQECGEDELHHQLYGGCPGKSLGRRLRAWRKGPDFPSDWPSDKLLRDYWPKPWSQQDLSHWCDVPRSTLGDIERGERDPTESERALIESVTGPL